MTMPSRPRAVFSTEDFELIRDALAHYIKTAEPGPDSPKFASLYHRLGRVVSESAPRSNDD